MCKSIEESKVSLVWGRELLSRRLERIRRDEQRLLPLAPADRAQDQEDDEVLERLDRATEQLLAQFTHAVERMQQGHYGTCETCGSTIPSERLAAMPQATQCARCAQGHT